MVVVSPDVGGVARARAFAKKLSDAPLAIVDKRRSAHNVSEVMNLIGDVKGKVAVLVDDMIDTAGTITNAGKVLHQEGAKAVYACATHAVFSPPARERLSCGADPAFLVLVFEPSCMFLIVCISVHVYADLSYPCCECRCISRGDCHKHNSNKEGDRISGAYSIECFQLAG
jgi:hypothetical protein